MKWNKVLNKIAFFCLIWASAILILPPRLARAKAQDPLPSWNEGPAKQAILSFVKKVTDTVNSAYVPMADRTLYL
jgi:hypothetical protein